MTTFIFTTTTTAPERTGCSATMFSINLLTSTGRRKPAAILSRGRWTSSPCPSHQLGYRGEKMCYIAAKPVSPLTTVQTLSEPKPIGDPSPTWVVLLPLPLVLHELLLHVVEGARFRHLGHVRKQIWKLECLSMGQLNVGNLVIRTLYPLVFVIPLPVTAILNASSHRSHRYVVDLLKIVLDIKLRHFQSSAELYGVFRLFPSWPHQCHEEVGPEDAQLWVSMLVDWV